jgi:thymidylate synthase (FAD)
MAHQLDPLQDGKSSLELIRVSGSDVDVVNAARVSYGKIITNITDRDKKLIKYLLEHGHTSPFEHNQLSFRVQCPIFVARQWMRHRMNSYNEISYRYTTVIEQFYVPNQWRMQDKVNKQASAESFENEALKKQYQEVIDLSLATYKQLLEAGVSRELARGVLPVCTYTQFIFTCNLHSLMHFIKLRLHEGASYEIQQYAKGMLELAFPYFPVSLSAWKEINRPDLVVENIPTLEQTLDL